MALVARVVRTGDDYSRDRCCMAPSIEAREDVAGTLVVQNLPASALDEPLRVLARRAA